MARAGRAATRITGSRRALGTVAALLPGGHPPRPGLVPASRRPDRCTESSRMRCRNLHITSHNVEAMAEIVVVEDEAELAVAIAARLRSDGHNVCVAEDGPGAVRLVGSVRPDLVVLDLMLPGFDGLEVCRQIQRDRPVPVIMLTARGSETDLLVGLAVGADDYLSKPFSMRELTARVRALLRRADRSASEAGAILRAGPVEIDVPKRRARRDGEAIALTVTEFDLLA